MTSTILQLPPDPTVITCPSSGVTNKVVSITGRTYNHQILDMIELGISDWKSLEEFTKSGISRGTKPCLLFHGVGFTQSPEHMRLKSLLLDLFRGPEVKNIRLSGFELAIQFTMFEGNIYMRCYRCVCIVKVWQLGYGLGPYCWLGCELGPYCWSGRVRTIVPIRGRVRTIVPIRGRVRTLVLVKVQVRVLVLVMGRLYHLFSNIHVLYFLVICYLAHGHRVALVSALRTQLLRQSCSHVCSLARHVHKT